MSYGLKTRHFIMISYETLPYIYFNENVKIIVNISKCKHSYLIYSIDTKGSVKNLDVKTVLCNKTWFVFNNSGEREIYIFQENGKLKISLNGKVTHATWEYIPANKSLIISGNEQSYMVHAAYVDNILFALQIDATKEYAFLIDENNKQDFLPQSYNDIKRYFQIKEEKQIQKEEAERKEKEHQTIRIMSVWLNRKGKKNRLHRSSPLSQVMLSVTAVNLSLQEQKPILQQQVKQWKQHRLKRQNQMQQQK